MATWQHLRSSTANKRPTTSLADGRIAINTNTASPGLFFKDSAGTGIVKVGPVHVGTTAPNSVPAAGGSSGNYTGEQWLDTSVSPAQMKVWNGSTWVGIVADELPVSKLQDGAARQLIQTDAAGTGVEWTSDVDVPGTLDVTSTATFDSIAQHPLGTAGAPTITFTGDNNTGIYSPGADQVAISTGGSGRLFVNSSGNIGVASSSVQSLGSNYSTLEIKGKSGGFGGGIILSPSDAATVPAVWYYDGLCNFGSLNSTPVSFLTNGTEKLRITSAGLVGVGTSSPSSTLHVAGAPGTSTTSNLLSLRSLSAPNASNLAQVDFWCANNGNGLEAVAAIRALNPNAAANNGGALTFAVSANGSVTTPTERMRIDQAGNVGIGTTSPGALLHVEGGTENAIIGSSARKLYFRADSGGVTLGTGAGQTGNGVYFSEASNFVYAQTNSTERARIDSSGRLLVGTSSSYGQLVSLFSPQLQVAAAEPGISIHRNANDQYDGKLFFSKARGSGYQIVNNNDLLGAIYFTAADGTKTVESVNIRAEVDGTPGVSDMPGRLVFSTTLDGFSSPSPRMIIKNNGNILIGTTTDLGGLISCESWGYGVKAGQIWNHTPSIPSGSADVIAFNYQGATVGKISITTTATTYSTSSDYRLKQNVVAVTDGITRLQQLKPSRFNFIADPNTVVDGFIAHEVQDVVPEAITGEKDAVDADGNPIYQGIDQSKLVPLLTAALQEAIGEIESLKARVAALESA